MRKNALLIFTCRCVVMALAGAPRAVCPTQTIKVVEGGNVALHCRLDSPVDLSRYTVEWTRVDNQQLVYVYRDGRDDPGSVAAPYRGRTAIDHEALSRGILTLKISSANLSDSGSYKGFVQELNASCEVHLIVEGKETKADVSNTTGPAVEGVTETDNGVSKDQQNQTKTHDSSTTVPPPEEEPESEDRGPETAAVLNIVLPVVGGGGGGGLLLLVVAAFLLRKYGVSEKCIRMLKGERQQEYERPSDIELQQRK